MAGVGEQRFAPIMLCVTHSNSPSALLFWQFLSNFINACRQRNITGSGLERVKAFIWPCSVREGGFVLVEMPFYPMLCGLEYLNYNVNLCLLKRKTLLCIMILTTVKLESQAK